MPHIYSLSIFQFKDPTFAKEFIRRNGTDFLVKVVETETQ